MNLQRYIKYYSLRFKRLQGSPRTLAGGTAIGVLIGLTPTMPFHTILIVFLTLVTRTSTLAAIIVSWIVCNPLTYLPIYYLSALIGNHLTPYELNLNSVRSTLEMSMQGAAIQKTMAILLGSGYEALIVMVVGGFILASPFALISYYLSFKFFVQIQKKRMTKHVLD